MRSSWALTPTRIGSLGALWVPLTLAQAAPLAPLRLSSPAHLGPTWRPGHLFSPRTWPPSPLPGDLPFAPRAPPESAPNPASPSDLRTGHPEDRAGCRGAPRAVPRAGPHVCLRRRHYGNQRPADGAAHLGDRGRHGAGRGRRRHRRAAGAEGRGRGRRAGAWPCPGRGGARRRRDRLPPHTSTGVLILRPLSFPGSATLSRGHFRPHAAHPGGDKPHTHPELFPAGAASAGCGALGLRPARPRHPRPLRPPCFLRSSRRAGLSFHYGSTAVLSALPRPATSPSPPEVTSHRLSRVYGDCSHPLYYLILSSLGLFPHPKSESIWTQQRYSRAYSQPNV